MSSNRLATIAAVTVLAAAVTVLTARVLTKLIAAVVVLICPPIAST